MRPRANKPKDGFLAFPRHRFHLELTLDFTRPVSVTRARETARKVLDAMNVQLEDFEPPEPLDDASLKCAELRRLIKLSLADRPDPLPPEG